MADANGANDRWDDLEGRAGALERARREMEGTLVVLADIQTRMSGLLRERAEWMAYIEPRLKRAEIQLSEMSDKISFIVDREMRREGGPETRR